MNKRGVIGSYDESISYVILFINDEESTLYKFDDSDDNTTLSIILLSHFLLSVFVYVSGDGIRVAAQV